MQLIEEQVGPLQREAEIGRQRTQAGRLRGGAEVGRRRLRQQFSIRSARQREQQQRRVVLRRERGNACEPVGAIGTVGSHQVGGRRRAEVVLQSLHLRPLYRIG